MAQHRSQAEARVHCLPLITGKIWSLAAGFNAPLTRPFVIEYEKAQSRMCAL